MGDKCKSYIPFEKFTRGDLDDIIHAFHTKFVNSDGPDWDWMEHMAYDSVNDEMGFKNGASCIGERGTGKQVFAIEIGEIDNFNYGWWHQGAFEATSQPFSQNPHGTCQKHKVQSRSLVVYACAAQPVDGSWGEWSEYGSCSEPIFWDIALCNQAGYKTRSRNCDSPAPKDGGQWCADEDGDDSLLEKKSTTCTGYCAPVDGSWGAWSGYGECNDYQGLTVRCNEAGKQIRSRSCDSPAPAHGGSRCQKTNGPLDTSEEQISDCSGYCAPVNGNWAQWSDFGECKNQNDMRLTASCEDNGRKFRTRECNNPAPAHDGQKCKDADGYDSSSEEDITTCYGYCEPVNGGFTDWSSWGECSEPCGEGMRSKTRTCTNPAPEHGGNPCDGDKMVTEECNVHACPINGGFSDWSSWGECSKSCGEGEKSKTRTCSNPPPQFGGDVCVGPKTDTEKCNEQACPGISAVCNDDNTISVKIDYDRAGSILSASYGTCGASDMAGADASNVKTWDVTLNPSRCGMETKLRTLNYTQK